MRNTLLKILSFTLAFVLSLSSMLPAFAADEIPEGYTPIYTAEDLNNIRNNLSESYILMNDIDLSGYENWEPIGTYEEPFAGVFDGDGHLIKNLNINCISTDTSTVYCGLFGKISKATVENATIYNAQISAKHTAGQSVKIYAAAAVGYAYFSNISNCAVSGTVESEGFSSTYIGGIVGAGGDSTFTSCCSNYADIKATVASGTASAYIGGIIGKSMHTTVQSGNLGNITVSGKAVSDDAEIRIGGITGSNTDTWVAGAYNAGTISVDFSSPGLFVGGISGCLLMGENLYNRGLIEVPETFSGCVGALSGNLESSQGGFGISYCIDKSYYLTTDFPAGYADGIHPDNMTEDEYSLYYSSAVELTDEEMKNQASFAEFDFDTVWVMEEGGYPVLQNQPIIVNEDNEPQTISLSVTVYYKQTKNLMPTAAAQKATWRCSDSDIAVADRSGNVTGNSIGTSWVYATKDDGTTIAYKVTVEYSLLQQIIIYLFFGFLWYI